MTAEPGARPLSLERFSALADAFGGDIRYWPEADRAAARSLAETSAIARTLLLDAGVLDALLDGSLVAAPSADVRRHILAAAPAAKPASARSRLWRWVSGLGAVGVLACGAAAGAAIVAIAGPSHLDADGLAGVYDQAGALDASGA